MQPAILIAVFSLQPLLEEAFDAHGGGGGGGGEWSGEVGQGGGEDVAQFADGLHACWVLLHCCCRQLDGLEIGLATEEAAAQSAAFELLVGHARSLRRSAGWASAHPWLGVGAVATAVIERLHEVASTVVTASPTRGNGRVVRGFNVLDSCLRAQGAESEDGSEGSEEEAHRSPPSALCSTVCQAERVDSDSDPGGMAWESD